MMLRTLLAALALLGLFVPTSHAWCPSGGGGGTTGIARTGGPARTRIFQTWMPWWQAHQALYFNAGRIASSTEVRTSGSSTAYGDATRRKVVEALTKALADKDRDCRVLIALALGKVGGAGEIEAITRHIERDTAREVRVNAVLALGFLQAPAGADYLKTRYLDAPKRDEVARHYAAVGLGMIGRSADIAALERVVRNPRENRGVRLGALVGLAHHQDVRVVALAADLLADEDEHKLVRMMAAHALARQSPVMALDIFRECAAAIREDKPVEQAVALALGQLQGKGVAEFVAEFAQQADDDLARRFAYLSLARQKDRAYTKTLIAELENASHRFRPFAALACGIQGDSRAIEDVRKYCAKYRSNTQYYAAGLIALGLLRDRRLIDDHCSAKNMRRYQRDALWQTAAVQALGLLGDPRGKDVVVGLLPDRMDVLAAPAAIALARLGADPLAVFDDALKRGKNAERRAAVLALGETARSEVVDRLIALLADPDKDVRGNAALALGQLFDKTEHGSVRHLAFGYSYMATPLDRSLRHLFAVP